jgi:hypothetical protein
MAYDEGLAERVRDALRGRVDVTERKMFGGLAFMAPAAVEDDSALERWIHGWSEFVRSLPPK